MIAPRRGGQGRDGHKEDRRDNCFPGWRVQNRTLKDSGENRTVRHVVLCICGKLAICAGVSLSCGYVCTGVSFYMWICSGSRTKSVTHLHPSPFSTPTSLRPCHFDSHSHFSLPFLVLEMQNLEPSRTKKNGTNVASRCIAPTTTAADTGGRLDMSGGWRGRMQNFTVPGCPVAKNDGQKLRVREGIDNDLIVEGR